jgi:cytochrome b subunit of formate dehydrogenase
MLDNTYVRITNSFLHDMATGTWAACLTVLLVLHGRLAGMPAEAALALGDAMRLVFWILVGALVVVSATGGIRLAYWRQQTAPGELTAKRRALIIKHVAFLAIYCGGSVWGWLLLP